MSRRNRILLLLAAVIVIDVIAFFVVPPYDPLAAEGVDAECVYYLLTWGAGEFEFTACLVEGADRVAVSTTHLLMEGARLMDEQSETAQASQKVLTVPPISTNPDTNPDDGW